LNRIALCLALLAILPRLTHAEYGLVDKVVIGYKDTTRMRFVHDPAMFREGWDTLAQPMFWKQVIRLTSDTCLVNVASCRRPVDKVCRTDWMNLSEEQKKNYKDSVCCELCLDAGTSIYVTAGKGEFYEIRKVLPDISKAIHVFEKNGVDPWFAQAILLIESPGKSKSKSYVGANGPFQLMRSVAIKYGLHVNRKVDERTNLEKAALAASKFINAVCIAQVKALLDEHHMQYQESDLWFRLLVLHAYHAGPGNVRCVINSLNPQSGGVELIRKIWQTECGGFKNESQNYSQISLATLLYFEQIIGGSDTVFLVQGDKAFRNYNRGKLKPTQAYDYLNNCLALYEDDLLEGTLPYADFMKRVAHLRKEYTYQAKYLTNGMVDIVLNQYPASDEHIRAFAYALARKQRYDDAIALLKINCEMHPTSIAAHDSLAKVYSDSGNKQMAALYSSKSLALMKKEEQ
jgi:hypothetical protein